MKLYKNYLGKNQTTTHMRREEVHTPRSDMRLPAQTGKTKQHKTKKTKGARAQTQTNTAQPPRHQEKIPSMPAPKTMQKRIQKPRETRYNVLTTADRQKEQLYKPDGKSLRDLSGHASSTVAERLQPGYRRRVRITKMCYHVLQPPRGAIPTKITKGSFMT